MVNWPANLRLAELCNAWTLDVLDQMPGGGLRACVDVEEEKGWYICPSVQLAKQN